MEQMKKQIRRALGALLLCAMTLPCAGAVNWGLWYGNGVNQPPSGEDSVQTLSQYGAYYMGSAADKVLYLTFDCGYENGNTAKILDTLKKHHVPAAFFVVGHYLDAAPALVRRMAAEGHLVCNHSAQHPNMTRVSRARFVSELESLQTQYTALTGRRLSPFFRPPEGAYTHESLRWAQQLGYHTTLWSVAYADWNPAAQPTYASARKTLHSRVHNGAIILLHAVSSTNAAILDSLLTEWKTQGYTFAALSALPGLPQPTVSALPNPAPFTVAGQPVAPTAFLIEGNNYIKLRDAAQMLTGTEKQFAVSYDAATGAVGLHPGQAYEALGTELTGVRDAAVVQAAPGASQITRDGMPLSLTAYLIDGENYIKLRDLAQALDCGVSYDSATCAVGLEPSQPYSEETV